jgi:hypothetical protein
MDNLFPNRRWLVIPTSITGSINWNQVAEISPSTLRLSVDELETFVKYDITEITASYSASYINATTGQTVYYLVEAGIFGRPDIYSSSYSEYEYQPMLDLLATPAWTSGSMPTLEI